MTDNLAANLDLRRRRDEMDAIKREQQAEAQRQMAAEVRMPETAPKAPCPWGDPGLFRL